MISTMEPESHLSPSHVVSGGEAEAQPIDLQPFGLKDDRPATISLEIENLDFYYGEKKALSNISLSIRERQVTAFIGPSGCGKSTLLRCFNRMNDLIMDTRVGAGTIRYRGTDIYEKTVDVIELRKQIGMVFQKSNPFPQTIFDNVAYGLRIQGIKDKSLIEERVEKSLRSSALWEEVKDRLHSNAYSLSGGQQQRMCIARACAVEPNVILMDEPCSALDPIATLKVEELIRQLREHYTIIVVTHNMEQAARVSDRTAFFYVGELIEEDATMKIFSNPKLERTEAYISGRFS